MGIPHSQEIIPSASFYSFFNKIQAFRSKMHKGEKIFEINGAH